MDSDLADAKEVTVDPVPAGLEGEDAATPGVRPRRYRPVVEAVLLACLALTLNLAGNGRVSLWDRDEPRYAGCTREMIARGDWLMPTFNAEPRYHKPVLIYWLMRGGFALGGDNPFGARLVSAVAGMGTSLLLLGLGRRMYGQKTGLLAALMLTTAPIVVAESKLATTDATLTFFLVGSVFCLWELSRRASRGLAATFWVLMALATLTKGPVGPALVASAGLVSWWCGGPTSAWRRLHWRWGLPLFALVAAPWYVAVGVLSHGDFFRFAIGKQIAERFTTSMEEHGGFPGYYLVTSLGTFHPWSALVPAAAFAAWQRRRTDPRFGFLLGWMVGPLILLECVKTKLVHYYLPAYPACALLVAWMVREVTAEGMNVRRWPLGRLSVGLLGGTGIGIAAALVAGAVAFPKGLTAPCLVTAFVVAVGTVWGLYKLQHAATERAVWGLALTWGLAMLSVGGWMLPATEPYRMTRVVGEKLGRFSRSLAVEPVLLSFQEPTLIYTMRRSAPLVRTWPQFYELLDRHGEVLAALINIEVAEFDRRKDHLDVEVCEVYQGFNLNKGETQTLQFSRIRRKATRPPGPTSDPMVGRAAFEQTRVKQP